MEPWPHLDVVGSSVGEQVNTITTGQPDVMAPLNARVRGNLREVCVLDPAISEAVAHGLGGREKALLGTSLPDLSPGAHRLTLSVWLLSEVTLASRRQEIAAWLLRQTDADPKVIILAKNRHERADFEPIPPEMVHLVLPDNTDPTMLAGVIENAFETLLLRYEKLRLQSRLALSYQDIQRITRIGQVMATERDLDKLIGMILDSAREMVAADGGSIYVVERKSGGEKPTHIRFKKSVLSLGADEFLLPIDSNSVAGYCALKGEPMRIDDVQHLTGEEGFRFNNEFDRTHGYHTKSMMLIPMTNHNRDVIGVIQLVNRKRDPSKRLTIEEMRGDGVRPFNQKDMELVSALAGQAAVAVQNTLLLQDIHNLFEGFVKASVTAIEQRDPTTSGHSFRVAEFTTGLAEAVDRVSDGEFSAVRFSKEQIRELRYASLLHDFGKVGVREQVLVKAKKLYKEEMELIKWRFLYIRQALENEFHRKKVRFLREHGPANFSEYEGILDAEHRTRLAEIDDMYHTIINANEPTVVEEGNFEKLERIGRNRIRIDSGLEVPFLRENELVSLSIRRGNLDQHERLEIESHVSHTYRFLIQIPWTQDLGGVPDIARGHHEKLNGTGYPLGLQGSEISVQTRMMTISDIYDALTAPDRPYKKSMRMEAALDILKKEAKDQHVDGKLLDIFIEAGVFRRVSSIIS